MEPASRALPLRERQKLRTRRELSVGGAARRFLATHKLIARTPALRDRSNLATLVVQRRITDVLATRLGLDGRDLRLRLLGEPALAAWRCAARNWIRGGERTARKVTALMREVDAAFHAIPATLALSAP